jgi:thiamine-phosphate pyrophosphorylase
MDQSLRARLRLYLVTDQAQTRGRSLIAVVEDALRGGVRAVQLRERDLDTRALTVLARQLRALTRAYDALLLINDRIDIALACEADGVHLPAHSFAVADARTVCGPTRLIGVSTHQEYEVSAAAHAGADFVAFGPVYETPSKQRYGAPVGLDALTSATRCGIPVLAIGGITTERVAEVRACGAAGVAVIRAILAAEDPQAAATALLRHFGGP